MEQNIRFTVIGRRERICPAEVLQRDGQEHPREPGQHRHGAVPGHQLRRPRGAGRRGAAAVPRRSRPARWTRTQIDEATISDALYTAGMPDPDLLIRTAGEMRVSNFLLWQISYAELWVTPTLLARLRRGRCCTRPCADFAGRERRFGGLGLREYTLRVIELHHAERHDLHYVRRNRRWIMQGIPMLPRTRHPVSGNRPRRAGNRHAGPRSALVSRFIHSCLLFILVLALALLCRTASTALAPIAARTRGFVCSALLAVAARQLADAPSAGVCRLDALGPAGPGSAKLDPWNSVLGRLHRGGAGGVSWWRWPLSGAGRMQCERMALTSVDHRLPGPAALLPGPAALAGRTVTKATSPAAPWLASSFPRSATSAPTSPAGCSAGIA